MRYHFRRYVLLFMLAGILLFVPSVPAYAQVTSNMPRALPAVGQMSTSGALMAPDVMTNVASAKPVIKFVSVPAYGSFDNLTGQVRRASPSQYRVVVYIYVRTGWWIKPYFSQPQTIINADGYWTCDITTGGFDQLATKIVAYLIPATYTPPSLLGAATLPAELGKHAVAKVKVTRRPPG